MNSEQFIDRLQSANQKELSYSIKEFNITESRPSPLESQKIISCSFIAGYSFGKAEIILSQGISISYTSMDEEKFYRSELQRIDYLDKVLVNGFDDIEGGRFDLVFLSEQLDRQKFTNPKQTLTIMESMIDSMFEFANIKEESIIKVLLNAFDDYILAMPEVKKLVTNSSETKLLDALNSLKMSGIEPKLEQSIHRVENIKDAGRDNLYQFVSGYVTSTFDIDEFHFRTTYYMQRKYPLHEHKTQVLGINDTSFDESKQIYIDSKSGELTLDLKNKEASLGLLGGNSALFFRLQSVFGLIKRQNQHQTITNNFDEFYLNSAELELSSKQRESILAPRLNHMFWRPFRH